MQIKQAGLDPGNPMIRRAVELASELITFPRHLSQHVGGYVLTQDRLDTCADREMPPWTIAPSSSGTRMTSTRIKDDEGRCAGAGHADLHPKMF